MTENEVEKYIAQIAFSGAEDFVKQYKTENPIIGHFGLGFFSSYMVAKKVEINTRSYIEEEKSVFWSCEGNADYTIEKGKRKQRGTEVILYIDDENTEYANEYKIETLLKKYCPFLPYGIYLNDKHINNKNPLWIKNQSESTEKEYTDFFKELYPFEPDPIFWIHLNVEYPFNLKGILYFPKMQKNFDISKNTIKLFCNRVFVSDNCKELLPDYLTILKGAIDSPDIPLNVSRSYLQMDRTVKQVGNHIAKKMADRLNSLYQTDRKKFIELWPHFEVILKLGVMQDEKFYEKVKNILIFQTATGDWIDIQTHINDLKAANKETIYYTNDEKSVVLDLYKEKNFTVLVTNPYLDTAFLSHLEQKISPFKFQRVDGGIDDSLIDKSKEKNILDKDGKTKRVKLQDLIKDSLEVKDLEVEAKSLTTNNIHAFFNDERRRKGVFVIT